MAFLSSGWLYFLGILVIIFIVVWAMLTKRPDEKEVTEQYQLHKTDDLETHPEESVPRESLPDVIEDDLEIIEGIGPKISHLLKQEGIKTFSQLSNVEEGELRKILDKAKLRISNPGTWSKQAKFAAIGDMDGLREYQSKLKGGVEN